MLVAMSCPRFVQNAWKKDLCSNCFKGKEDHAPVVDNRARYLANLKEITKRPPPPSILKGVIRKNVAAFKVHFPKEESQVIGYGGDEFSENEEEDDSQVEENASVEEDPGEDEDYEKFQRLTESNTEFNKDPANLSIDTSNTKITEIGKKTAVTPLKLGQAQNTSNGKKPTLLVSVQPFGAQATPTPLSVSRKTHLNNLLHDTADSLKLTETTEVKSSFTSITKPECPGGNKTDISSEKDESSNVLKETVCLPEISHVNNVIVNGQTNDNVEKTNTDPSKLEDENIDSNKKTESLAENRLNSLIEGKKGQLTRGTILTKTHEQAKTKRYFQLGPVKPSEELPISDSLYKKLETKDFKTSTKTFSKAKDTISLKTNIHQKNVKNIANGLFSSKLLKKEFGIQSDLPLTRMKSIEYVDSKESAISERVVDEVPVEEKRKSVLSEMPAVNFVKILPSEGSVGRTDQDEVVIIDGVPAESREMAGEPDGRADSDDLDEPPPDLPTTPPPLIIDHIPRSSFLHSIPKEKPKLPLKPKLRDKSPPKDLTLDLTLVEEIPSDPSLSPSGRHSLITKRQAPQPPPTPTPPGESPPKFVQSCYTPTEGVPQERRERASSCSPLPSDSSSGSSHAAESVNRRSLSISHETLTCTTPTPALDKKKSNKMRLTLRKFLRLASREEFKCEELDPPPLPPPRPRPEIIHPLDLNKSAVQVLRSDGSLVCTNRPQISSQETPSSPTSSVSPTFHVRPNKPPPPPRSQSLDSAMGMDQRPARPPPPHKDLLSAHRPSDPVLLASAHSVYVNLGEVRSAMAPAKPQRTASLREKDNMDLYQPPSALQISENLYESLAPECDLSRERSSLPYYGSETESDIYCPYTFANSQKGGEELRACKTRSVVHKNLEDNYGAVVIANHEALTQLLEQVSQGPVVPAALWPLKTSSGLQWTDFTVDAVGSGCGEMVCGRVFVPATWNTVPVSLCLTAGQARLPACFVPVTQFFDLVDSKYLHQERTDSMQVSVAVLVKQQFFSLSSFTAQMSSSADVVRESALLMVQVVNSLKTLQAQGREEAGLSQFVLAREENQFSPRVFLLPLDTDKTVKSMSLCQCALKAVELLSLPQPLKTILCSVLTEEHATSLTQAKGALELWLWGPTHVPVTADTQSSLQRWLDLERATVLHSLVVRRPLTLNCSDYCHLSFLVRTNAKIIADALTLLDRPATSSVATS